MRVLTPTSTIPFFLRYGHRWLLSDQPYELQIGGGQMRVRPRSFDTYILGEVFCEKVYSPLLALRGEPTTVVDLGAHIGAFTVWAALRWSVATILSVEMERENFALLQHNIRLNRLDTRVSTIRAAIWHSTEKISVRRHPKNSGMHQVAAPGEGEEVPAITLEHLFSSQKLGHVDLLKMDIEGAEDWVFMDPQVSLLSEHVRYLAAEIHPGIAQARAIEAIERAGFQVWMQRQTFNKAWMLHAVNLRLS